MSCALPRVFALGVVAEMPKLWFPWMVLFCTVVYDEPRTRTPASGPLRRSNPPTVTYVQLSIATTAGGLPVYDTPATSMMTLSLL